MMGVGYLLAIGFAYLPTLYTTYASKMVREFPLAGQVDLGSGPYLVAALLLLGMTLVGYLGLNDERRGGAFWAAGGTLAGLVLIVIVIAIPHINRYVVAPPQELAYAAGLNLDRQDQFIAYGTTETVVRILRETQDTLRALWGRRQDTDGTERDQRE